MKILALEFSTDQRSVAIVEGGRCLALATKIEGRATNAFALIEEVLRQAKLEREQIECLAIALGPGSYTGIRTAIALAQGWQLGLGIKLLGISSVDCLAQVAKNAGIQGSVNIVIDAQRNEVYHAQYQIAADAVTASAQLKIVTLETLRTLNTENQVFIGSEITRWFPDAKTVFPTADVLGAMAALRTDYVAGETLEPIYLREPGFVKAPPPRVLPS